MTATRTRAGSSAASEVLAHLRGLVSNAEVAQCIPSAIERAGFDRVVFSPVPSNGAGKCPAVPIFVWHNVMGVLHGEHADDRDTLTVLAEGIGAIFERNIALEQVQAMRATAQAHAATVQALTGILDE